MKIIDLLNKIANGEEVPEKIFYAEQYWINGYPNDYEGLEYGGCLLNNVCLNHLNDKVEIIEENNNKIERPEFMFNGVNWTTEQQQELIKNFGAISKTFYEIIKKINGDEQ